MFKPSKVKSPDVKTELHRLERAINNLSNRPLSYSTVFVPPIPFSTVVERPTYENIWNVLIPVAGVITEVVMDTVPVAKEFECKIGIEVLYPSGNKITQSVMLEEGLKTLSVEIYVEKGSRVSVYISNPLSISMLWLGALLEVETSSSAMWQLSKSEMELDYAGSTEGAEPTRLRRTLYQSATERAPGGALQSVRRRML